MKELKSADSTTTVDIFSRSSLADIAKHSELANARNHVQTARIALENARRHIANIPNIQPENIQSLNLFVDLMYAHFFHSPILFLSMRSLYVNSFDGPLGETADKQKIHDSVRKLEITVQNVFNALTWVDTNLASTINPAFFQADSTFTQARNTRKEERVRLLMQLAQRT